jgi:methionine biosynthesis protein MetW
VNTHGIYDAIWERKQSGADRIAPGSRAAVALELIGSGERVLDLGCGDGTLGVALMSRYKEVYGADISDRAVAMAQQRGIQAAQVNLDTEALPFADGLFSAVTCLDVLEHVFDPRSTISEIARVCAPGAKVIITTPNMRYWRHILSIATGRFPRTSSDEEGYDGGHLHYYAASNLADLLAESFVVQKVRGVPGGPTIGTASKILHLVFPGRLGAEVASPGIAVAAQRR